jgi:hypothetical protein
MCLLLDDIVKFVSEPASPPRLVEIPEEVQERLQLRSRFSRLGLPNVLLIQDPPNSLEASLPVSPRKPRNVAHKRVAKKLKVTETTSQEVSSSSRVIEYLSFHVVYAYNKILLLVGDSTFRPRRPRGRR